jgi:hypothetical protein
VAHLPLEQQTQFKDLLGAAGRDFDAGVVAANHHERQRYWTFWTEEFVEPFHGVDAMLCVRPRPNRPPSRFRLPSLGKRLQGRP